MSAHSSVRETERPTVRDSAEEPVRGSAKSWVQESVAMYRCH